MDFMLKISFFFFWSQVLTLLKMPAFGDIDGVNHLICLKTRQFRSYRLQMLPAWKYGKIKHGVDL
jgi:hypothetical protein